MFHELRQYDLRLSGVAAFLESFEKFCLPALIRCGFQVAGAWLEEIGPETASRYVWMAQWEHLNARTEALEKVYVDPDFLTFVQQIQGIVRHIDTRILRNVSFSPLLAR